MPSSHLGSVSYVPEELQKTDYGEEQGWREIQRPEMQMLISQRDQVNLFQRRHNVAIQTLRWFRGSEKVDDDTSDRIDNGNQVRRENV